MAAEGLPVSVAAVQLDCAAVGPVGAVSARLNAMRTAAQTAAPRLAGRRILVFPELAATGYGISPEQAWRCAEPPEGGITQWVAEHIARPLGCAVCFGFVERAESAGKEVLYNSCALVSPDGKLLAVYRKSHLFGPHEARIFSPSPRDTPGGTIGACCTLYGLRVAMLICYDVEFPEAVRCCALNQADLVLVPTANPVEYSMVSKLLVPARAVESQVLIAYANISGREAGAAPGGAFEFGGTSVVAGPDEALSICPAAGGGWAELRTDSAALAASRARNPYLRDRRPELYSPVCRCRL
eukprot:TRINITY_DN42613_c0_g1_i1.p1 TRINITY_DN42613_c0_g1~~TRINITY_DN42613_c0_g1_i1.p1  ORF type:complete len:326 (+),score=41.68 TRINITY_DN42613_c0_g1_i1:87-980(+)